MNKIIITALGKKTNIGIYIGRPNTLGNPYPTKVSNFKENGIYTHEESMKKYQEYIKKELKNENSKIYKLIGQLSKRIKEGKEVQLNCWCLSKKIEKIEDIEENNIKCHGEIIAKEILLFNT